MDKTLQSEPNFKFKPYLVQTDYITYQVFRITNFSLKWT